MKILALDLGKFKSVYVSSPAVILGVSFVVACGDTRGPIADGDIRDPGFAGEDNRFATFH